jgi:hypothetical protein
MSEKKYISGIHSYCDRWCERCAFTARCRVFEADPSNMEALPDDPDNPEFWDKLRNHFQDALDMLQNMTDDLDIPEIDQEEAHDEEEQEEDAFDEDIQDDYATAVEDFFQNNESYFFGQESDYEEKVKMGIPVDVEQLGFLQEALRTIRWFQHFIYPKMSRAFSHSELDPESPDDLQSDGNGSAKVAMIAIQRSIDAWTFVQTIFKEKKEEIKKLQQLLVAEKAKLEKGFPNWEQFHRPGFDDEPDTVVRLDFNPN